MMRIIIKIRHLSHKLMRSVNCMATTMVVQTTLALLSLKTNSLVSISLEWALKWLIELVLFCYLATSFIQIMAATTLLYMHLVLVGVNGALVLMNLWSVIILHLLLNLHSRVTSIKHILYLHASCVSMLDACIIWCLLLVCQIQWNRPPLLLVTS